MAIRSIPGFSSQKALERSASSPHARSSALWVGEVRDDATNRIVAALWIVIACHHLTTPPFGDNEQAQVRDGDYTLIWKDRSPTQGVYGLSPKPVRRA